jgi:flagellar biosynthetic protein FlhB
MGYASAIERVFRHGGARPADRERALLVPLDLHFFDEAEKTEKPTGRKRSKARREGQVAKSQEVSTAVLFLAGFYALRVLGGGIYTNLMGLFSFEFDMVPNVLDIFESVYMARYISYLFQSLILIVLPFFAVVLVCQIIANLVQVGWHPTTKPLMPKFSKLDPITGFKRLFSMQALLHLFNSVAKFGIIAFALYTMMQQRIAMIPRLVDMDVLEALIYIGLLITDMGLLVGVMFIFIAAIDYPYSRYSHTKSLRMTKFEVKEEFKQTEGNPQVKSRIRRKMQEISMRRMMQNVPQADVIITNPTHYAVAIKYERLTGRAPLVVAKGADFVAKRIREKAAECGVPVMENAALARALYNDVEIGEEVPPELWEAVIEILLYVFRLRGDPIMEGA